MNLLFFPKKMLKTFKNILAKKNILIEFYAKMWQKKTDTIVTVEVL